MAAGRRSRIRELSADPAVAARQAKDLCLRMLTDRARTRAELADVLTAEGVEPAIVTAVLDRLVELRLVDDAAYAEAFVRSRARAGVARQTMNRELRSKGIGEQDAAAALDDLGPEQEREAAVLLASVRARRMAGLPEQVVRRRLYGLLARRGYPNDLVVAVLDQVVGGLVLGEQAEDSDVDIGACPDQDDLRRSG
jgi:regulatory protein